MSQNDFSLVGNSCVQYQGSETACSNGCDSNSPNTNSARFKATQCYILSDEQTMQLEIMTNGPISCKSISSF